MTVGGNAQGTKDTQQAGAQAILATGAGIFTCDAGITHDTTIGFGHFERLQYDYYPPHQSLLGDANLNLSVQ